MGRLDVVKYLVTEGKADPNQPTEVLSRAYDAWDIGVCVIVIYELLL